MPKDITYGKSITLLNKLISNEEKLQYQFLNNQTKLKLEVKQRLIALETEYKEKKILGKNSIDKECESIKENLSIERTKLYNEYQKQITEFERKTKYNIDKSINIVVRTLLRG